MRSTVRGHYVKGEESLSEVPETMGMSRNPLRTLLKTMLRWRNRCSRSEFPGDRTGVNGTDIIYTGNLGTGQAMVPFIKGFSDAGENLDLIIVGDGERREELESLVNQLSISDQVRFEGYVDRNEIPEMIANAKISLVSLKTEYQLDYARPTKLLETMTVGTPYIESKTGVLDILPNKSNSGVVVNNQPEEVTEALDHLLSSSELRQRKGNNAMEFVKHNHQ